MASGANPALPAMAIARLHDRHPGLTESVAGLFSDSAAVCLSRHHISPIEMVVSNETSAQQYSVAWSAPDALMLRALANTDETTEFGACGVTLAAIEAMAGLVAVERADRRTGADYYVAADAKSFSLEAAIRLEISGVDHGAESIVAARLREKVRQARRGISDLPAIASVVGFRVRRVMFQSVGMSR